MKEYTHTLSLSLSHTHTHTHTLLQCGRLHIANKKENSREKRRRLSNVGLSLLTYRKEFYTYCTANIVHKLLYY